MKLAPILSGERFSRTSDFLRLILAPAAVGCLPLFQRLLSAFCTQFLEIVGPIDPGLLECFLHLALDADSGEIIAQTLTGEDTGDASQVEPLLDHIDGPIGQFTADGAYDGKPTYDTVINHSAAAAIVIPPRANAVEPSDDRPPGQRDQHIAAISRDGRMKWQVSTGYGKRSLVETAIGRYKSIIGPRLRARLLPAQQTEAAIGCAVLNRMLACARPKSVRRKEATK